MMRSHHLMIALGALALCACGESQTASTDDNQYATTDSTVANNEPMPADPNASTGYTTPDTTSPTAPGASNDSTTTDTTTPP